MLVSLSAETESRWDAFVTQYKNEQTNKYIQVIFIHLLLSRNNALLCLETSKQVIYYCARIFRDFSFRIFRAIEHLLS